MTTSSQDTTMVVTCFHFRQLCQLCCTSWVLFLSFTSTAASASSIGFASSWTTTALSFTYLATPTNAIQFDISDLTSSSSSDEEEEEEEEEDEEDEDDEDDQDEPSSSSPPRPSPLSLDPDADPEGCLVRNPNGSCRMYSNVQHFRNSYGDLEFKWSSCDDPYDENHDSFLTVAKERSLYQKILFEENLEKEDKCLRLDATLQQCSSYRPHYHEPFVHLSGSYLNRGYVSGVRRVVFVGGGDSMLLHEVMKYHTLELVLGLELDQKVTRNSFDHFKTQPHFDDPKVQWWFGDGAKSLTLLPRHYFGTFDLVLLDLSETVMSMSVTKSLDVFGAMKLLLSPTGILVKNDFGYFEKLARVFDTCLQLLIPDVTYICDYELVLCSSDKVDLLNPTFHHLDTEDAGARGVETLVYKPRQDVDDHWGPVTDFSKYWGEPRDCNATAGDAAESAEEEVAHAGVLMIVEAEKVSFPLDDVAKLLELKDLIEALGYRALDSDSITVIDKSKDAKYGGISLSLPLHEGYLLLETFPAVRYCKLDIHLWGGFDKQPDIRTSLLSFLGVQDGQWSSYRIVTGGMRGCDTRPHDLQTVGPDPALIHKCPSDDDEAEFKKHLSDPKYAPGTYVARVASSTKHIVHDATYDDEPLLGPLIDAAIEDIVPIMIGKSDLKAVVMCPPKGRECRAKMDLEKQKSQGRFARLITLYQCSKRDLDELDYSTYNRGRFLQSFRESLEADSDEYSNCAKRNDFVLKELSEHVHGLNLVVVDALADTETSGMVKGAHQFWLQYWQTIQRPFLLLVPILDRTDEDRMFFLNSRFNHGEEEPEFYSEIFVGTRDPNIVGEVNEGEGGGKESERGKTMSFGLIHEGSSTSLQKLLRVALKLQHRDEIKFAEIRKITIRGAMREQVDYDPVTFSWMDYDQVPGLEQFYGQRAVGVQTVFQLQLVEGEKGEKKKTLTSHSIREAFDKVVASMGIEVGISPSSNHSSHSIIGEGSLSIALFPRATVALTWDGLSTLTINLFTYDEDLDHHSLFVSPFLKMTNIPKMKIFLKDEQPRGYNKVINKSDRVNRLESPSCYDYYKLCPKLKEKGNCDGGGGGKGASGARNWMKKNCRFSCGVCGKDDQKDGGKDVDDSDASGDAGGSGASGSDHSEL